MPHVYESRGTQPQVSHRRREAASRGRVEGAAYVRCHQPATRHASSHTAYPHSERVGTHTHPCARIQDRVQSSLQKSTNRDLVSHMGSSTPVSVPSEWRPRVLNKRARSDSESQPSNWATNTADSFWSPLLSPVFLEHTVTRPEGRGTGPGGSARGGDRWVGLRGTGPAAVVGLRLLVALAGRQGGVFLWGIDGDA